MATLGFEQVYQNRGRFWKVAERMPAEIGYKIPDMIQPESDPPF